MNDFDQQEAILQERRKRYAQQYANAQAPQSQMVGGRLIGPNPLEYLAAGLRGYGGMKGEEQTNQEIADLQAKKQEAMQGDMSAMIGALRGTPEKTISAPSPFDTEGAGQFTMPAQAGSMDKFYEVAAKSQFPQYQQMGMQGALSAAQQQAQAAQKAQENQRFMGILQSSTPQQAIAAGVPVDLVKSYYESRNYGRDKVTYQKAGSGDLVPVTEYGDTPANAKPISNTGNKFSDLLITDPITGEVVPNQPLVGAKVGIAKAGKPQITVDARNFNTQESEQSKAYGKTLGEMRGTITQAGFDAPKKIAQLDRMEQLIGALDAGGKGAPLAADIASYAQSVGIKLDPKLGVKEAAQALAVEMAGNMRTPGTGPMTDKDFDNFLKRVPDLSKTPAGRKEITTTMRAALQRDLEASKFARDYAKANGGVIDDNFYDAMAEFYAKNPVVTPQLPATNARGQSLPKFEGDKESRYQAWKKAQGMK
jgi:hypothetical protein